MIGISDLNTNHKSDPDFMSADSLESPYLYSVSFRVRDARTNRIKIYPVRIPKSTSVLENK